MTLTSKMSDLEHTLRNFSLSYNLVNKMSFPVGVGEPLLTHDTDDFLCFIAKSTLFEGICPIHSI
jgi:hypothetical protein